jgi:hypothetical protein
MVATDADYEQIKALQNQAKGLTTQAGELKGGATTFESDVMEKVRAHRAQRGVGNLTQDIGNVTGRLASYRPEMEERLNMVNPLQAEKLMGQQRGDILSQLTRLGLFQEQNEGTVQEIIGAGANKLLAQAQKLQAEAEAKQAEAQAMFQILQQKALEAQREFENQLSREEFEEKKRQFNITSQKGSGGSGGYETLGSTVNQDTDSYAIEYLAGRIAADGIPSKIRGAVLARAQELQRIGNQKAHLAKQKTNLTKMQKSAEAIYQQTQNPIVKGLDWLFEPFGVKF